MSGETATAVMDEDIAAMQAARLLSGNGIELSGLNVSVAKGIVKAGNWDGEIGGHELFVFRRLFDGVMGGVGGSGAWERVRYEAVPDYGKGWRGQDLKRYGGCGDGGTGEAPARWAMSVSCEARRWRRA